MQDTRGMVRLRALSVLVLLALTAVVAAGCDRDEPLSPPAGTLPAPGRVLGLVEVTITGLGTGEVSASAFSAPDVAALERLRAARDGHAAGGLALQSLAPPANADASGDGTIQLEPLATGSFTDGERGAAGVRHLWATFRVRNADTLGTAYDTERQNLTFLAVGTAGTGGTIDETAISALRRFDGGPADPAIAAAVLPTGAVVKDPTGNMIESAGPDVLQLLTEVEAADVLAGAPAGVATVFPYGFVVRTPDVTPASRTLPASPAADQFDGLVTFAFKVPLQAAADEDPFTVSILFLAVDDSEVRVTQSLEEQGPAARAALEARASILSATLTLLPGGGASRFGTSERIVCEVRTAGFTSAAATLFPPSSGKPWLIPGPQGAGPYFIRQNAQLGAARCPAIAAADASTFVVHGFQGGPPAGAYTGAGTPQVQAPAGDFFPGEIVEVTLTTGLGGAEPTVARYRVASGIGSGDVAPAGTGPVAVGTGPQAVTAADLDGNGDLDLATANAGADSVSVLLGDGAGGLAAAVDYAAGDAPADIAAGDLDGDGDLDLATASTDGNDASVLLNNGDGTFGTAAGYAVGSSPSSIAIADLDGDGDLDLATANRVSNDVSVLLNTGSGNFAALGAFGAGVAPADLAVGDLDEDGDLDLAIASATTIEFLSVLMNDGDGSFAPVVQYPAALFGPTGSFDGIAIADFDGDGHLDVAMALNAVLGPITNPAVIALRNEGDGTFTLSTFVLLLSPSRLAAAADLDGDRAMDLILLRDDVAYVRINAGDGTFKEGTSHAVGTAPVAAAVADLDGNTDLDLAVVNNGTNDVSVLLHQ